MIGERSFRHAESTWVGAVTGAGQTPTPGCPMGMQVNNASNFVLGHSGESYDGPTGPTETFEIRGKSKNGKIREVDIRPDGTVEELE